MRITVNGKEAVIKDNTESDLNFENPRFGDVETWSMTITFPLKGCPENVSIFGHINRKDVYSGYMTLPTVISNLNFRISGVLVVTEVNEVEAKGQFLAGRTLQNSDESLTDVKINKLSLGYFPMGFISSSDSPAQYAKGHSSSEPFGGAFVSVPWINATTGEIENEFGWRNSGPGGTYGFYYTENTLKNGGISFCIYLYDLTERILLEAGFSSDLSDWKNSHFYNLLCLNSAPASSGVKAVRYVLPDWTLQKYLEQVGLLMNGYFNIDFNSNTVTFHFYSSDENRQGQVTFINSDIDSFSKTSTRLDETDCVESANLNYSGGSDESVFAEDSCDWFIDKMRAAGAVVDFDSLDDYMEEINALQIREMYWNVGSPVETIADKVAYCRDVEQYFFCKIWEKKGDDYYKEHRPSICKLNTFGNRLGKKQEDQPVVDLDIVPVSIISESERFNLPVLSPGEVSDNMKYDSGKIWDNYDDFMGYTSAEAKLAEGDSEDGGSLYDKLFVGFWLGWSEHISVLTAPPQTQQIEPFVLPPITDNIQKSDYAGFKIWDRKYSLRLNCASAVTASKFKIDVHNKYEISFISDVIPSVYDVFVIKGKRFVCSKLTAKLRNSGFSQLIKGTFYMIID